jgi:hypothetical protein
MTILEALEVWFWNREMWHVGQPYVVKWLDVEERCVTFRVSSTSIAESSDTTYLMIPHLVLRRNFVVLCTYIIHNSSTVVVQKFETPCLTAFPRRAHRLSSTGYNNRVQAL